MELAWLHQQVSRLVVLFSVVQFQCLFGSRMVRVCPVTQREEHESSQIGDVVKVVVEKPEKRDRELVVEPEDVTNGIVYRRYPAIWAALGENELYVRVSEVGIDEVRPYKTSHLDDALT